MEASLEDRSSRVRSRDCRPVRRVSGQGDGAFVGVNTELFRYSGAGQTAQREHGKARYNRASMDRRHRGPRFDRQKLVPVERIELPTFGLQNRCSTAELNRHFPEKTASSAARSGQGRGVKFCRSAARVQ